MIINDNILEELLRKAAESPRLRMNLDMRTSEGDDSQRMLNALLPGTPMPIHRHRSSSESVIVLRGHLTEIFYNDQGLECGRYDLDPKAGRYGLQIPKGMWHTIIVHEPSVIFEAKDGAYEPLSSVDVWAMD